MLFISTVAWNGAAAAAKPVDRAAAFAARDEARRIESSRRQWAALDAARQSTNHPPFSAERYVEAAALDWWESALRNNGNLDWQARHPPIGVLGPQHLTRLDGVGVPPVESHMRGHAQFIRGEYLWALAVRATPYPRGAVAFYGPEDSATYLRATMWNQDMAAEPTKQRAVDLSGEIESCMLSTISRYRVDRQELSSLEAAMTTAAGYRMYRAETRVGPWRYTIHTNDGRTLAILAIRDSAENMQDVFLVRGLPMAGAAMTIAAKLGEIDSSLFNGQETRPQHPGSTNG